MTLRLLHTADNHIGLSFNQYPEPAKGCLIEERFASLGRLVTTANERKAVSFVVAGDFFDKTTLAKALVERVVKILGKLEGEAVLSLASNDDFCEGPDSKIWKQFRAAADGTRVLALTEPGTRDFASDDYRVCFHTCPYPTKHDKKHTIAWVDDQGKPSDRLYIGTAHGNFEGLGLDADQRYFNMADSGVRKSGLHTGMVGRIDVPPPALGTIDRLPYLMPGIHAESVRATPLHFGKLRSECRACVMPARPNRLHSQRDRPSPNSITGTSTASSFPTTPVLPWSPPAEPTRSKPSQSLRRSIKSSSSSATRIAPMSCRALRGQKTFK